MRKLLLDALDSAVQAHIAKMFNVLITDPTSEAALERFSKGIGDCLIAYERMKLVICKKCDGGS
jgi:ABC-type sulfate transport system substrate-binding protein